MKLRIFRAAMLATGTLALVGLSTGAEAGHRHRHHHVATYHFGRYLASRHFHYQHRHFRRVMTVARKHPRFTRHAEHETGAKPSCFWTARSMGGPCGCWAEWKLLDLTQHVWKGINMWLADDWRRAFPHVPPAPGTAAVFVSRGGRAYHVAPVKAVSSDRKYVTLHDSWAIHQVRTAGLIFVQPPVRHVPTHGDAIRYVSGTPL
jgi:hypothetical protein